MENCTHNVPHWVDVTAGALGVGPGGVIGILSALASVGVLGCLTVLPYCFRLCRGHDVITECKIGRSVLTFSIDATGNGLHAAQKLVVDGNTRKVVLLSTGMEDSPPALKTDTLPPSSTTT